VAKNLRVYLQDPTYILEIPK